MEWKGQKETSYKKGLQFSYDGVNRLTSASNAGGSAYTYAETETGITYDKNGNLTSLTRGSATGNIDQLTYNYGSTPSNKLNTISDGSGNATGVKTGLTGNYSYDNNGNMTRDMGRNATLTYNYLNLPASAKIGTGPTYTYEYDASGVKHKYVADSTFKYEGAFEYNQNSAFKRLAITDGQVMLRNGALELNYYVKDHLGNNRIAFDKDGKTLQQTDYYAFGLEIDRNPPSTATPPPTLAQIDSARNEINRYVYNGKEKQRATNYLDYGARMYDPAIGRWGGSDLMTEKYSSLTPYNYVVNNPINVIDPNGMEVEEITTRYVNPNGKTILNTNDGRNDVFVVSWDQLPNFQNNIKYTSPGMLNSVGWNNYWRSEFKELLPGSLIDQLHASEKGIEALARYALKGDPKDFLTFEASEIAGQWSDPELVIGALSTGLAAQNILKKLYTKGITKLSPYELEITHGLTKSKSAFAKLKAEIKLNGVQEPIKFVEHNGHKFVVDGHHRLRAAKELGIKSIPVEQVKLPYAGYKSTNDLIYSNY